MNSSADSRFASVPSIAASSIAALALSLFAPQLRATAVSVKLVSPAENSTVQEDDKAKRRSKKSKDADAEDAEEESPWGALESGTFSGLKWREIGPALPSGRVIDFAVHPETPKVYYAAIASGGVFKTENAGTTWKSIFDKYPSYSTGSITLDPNNPLIVWLGTGENNSQRSVSYGDGVYRSLDGGKSWKNMGLKESEHIGMITVDPRDSDTVFVAAQGPLWRAGGDRGLYKTTDAGENWELALEIDEHTGVSEVLLDPRDPDVVYAVAYQRARRVWTLINGGPGSGLHKSTDGGKTWRKINKGLPGGDRGRIGIAMAPSDPDRLYAIVETKSTKTRGTYMSKDGGENWSKRSSYVSGSPQYYQELVVDPHNRDRVYSMDTFLMVTENGGEDWNMAGEEHKHVDNHAMWIDPEDTDHLLVGCDGGIYETFDRAATWNFRANLPVVQFYKIAVDNDEPFYNVYGGTQDNNTVGGPSQTTHRYGISNREWFVTVGGDGFQPAVDPEDPNIVYSQSQHGNLVRHDRLTGENIRIRPQEEPGEAPLKWNWDSPLLISPHDPARLYFAAQRVFRSDNRGNSWQVISEDLDTGVNRNELEIMGKVWSIDAVAKNSSTSLYGSVVALSESRLVEGLLYSGSDDGLIQVLEPGSGDWRRSPRPDWVPERSYVSDIVASSHEENVVYATYNNHKMGDFKPYVIQSADRGRTWTSISSDLPERGSTWAIVDDPVAPNLLYLGTEFGAFFSVDAGAHWVQLKSGIPTISVRDIAIQERENDLVLGTFGRGFFILDDLTPLRQVSQDLLEKEAVLFEVEDPKLFMPSNPISGPKGSLGHSFYTAPNPEFGATFTYYLKESLESLAKQRKTREKEVEKAGEPVAYPTWDELRAEEDEVAPRIVFTIADEDGNVLRTVTGSASKGIHRAHWDLRLAAANPPSAGGGGGNRFSRRRATGPPAVPGTYTVSMAKEQGGELTPLGESQTFTTQPLRDGSLPSDRQAIAAFQVETRELQRVVLGTQRSVTEARSRIGLLRTAATQWPSVPRSVHQQIDAAEENLDRINVTLNGDRLLARNYEPTPTSLSDRMNGIVFGHWGSTSNPTDSQRRAYEIVSSSIGAILAELRVVLETDLPAIDQSLDAAGAPWTPGRLPSWP